MNYLKGIKWFLAAIFISGTINADLIIDSQVIPGSDIQAITVGPDTGNIFITTKTGYTVTPDASEPPPPSTDVVITSFLSSPSVITEGQSVNITWTSQNAATCTASGGAGNWATSVETSGSTDIVINGAGTYTFTLQCIGDAGSDQKQLVVTVNIPPAPKSNCDAPSLGGVTTDWSAFWDGSAFPDPVFKDKFTAIPRNGYLAIEFNTGDTVDTGLLTSIESTATSGRRLGAISQCPGDFDVADDRCLHRWGVGGEIFWSTQGYSKACILEPNTTYYFNLTFTDGVDPASSECINANCITKVRAKNP